MTDIYQPDLQNQFNRLIQLNPRNYQLGTRWNDVVHGHDYDAENCMATMGAVAADAQTQGSRVVSPATIRAHQSDFAGGIGLEDVQRSMTDLHIKPIAIPDKVTWADSMAFVRERRFVIWAVLYGHIPYAFQEQKGGTFAHALGGCIAYPDGSFDRYDSLGHAIKRVPQYAARGAAEALAVAWRGTKTQLVVGVTDPMPIIGPSSTTFRYGGTKSGLGRWLARVDGVLVYSQPSFTHGQVVGRLDRKQSIAVAQTTATGESFHGSRSWKGTRDGRQWVQSEYLWFSGHSNGTEDVT